MKKIELWMARDMDGWYLLSKRVPQWDDEVGAGWVYGEGDGFLDGADAKTIGLPEIERGTKKKIKCLGWEVLNDTTE